MLRRTLYFSVSLALGIGVSACMAGTSRLGSDSSTASQDPATSPSGSGGSTGGGDTGVSTVTGGGSSGASSSGGDADATSGTTTKGGDPSGTTTTGGGSGSTTSGGSGSTTSGGSGGTTSGGSGSTTSGGSGGTTSGGSGGTTSGGSGGTTSGGSGGTTSGGSGGTTSGGSGGTTSGGSGGTTSGGGSGGTTSGGGSGGTTTWGTGATGGPVVNPDPTLWGGSIHASRAEGVAPLAVFFEGTGITYQDTSVNPFHDLDYEWTFGDPSAGTWTYTGRSRDFAAGPEAAHVFETPGTYDVRVDVHDPQNNVATYQVTVTVDDPNSVFAGANTLCFSPAGDFTDCPAGAQHITTASFDTVMSDTQAGNRLLIHRGEALTSSGSATINNLGPGIIGAYGTGADPIITSTHGGPVLHLSSGTPNFADWRVMDLEFDGPGSGNSLFLSTEGTVHQLLVERVIATNFGTIVSIPTTVLDYYGLPDVHSEIAFVDCQFSHDVGGLGYGIYMASAYVMLLGDHVWDCTGGQHTVRLPFMYPGVIEENLLADAAPTKHVLKLHGPSPTATGVLAGKHTGDFVISDNTFVGGAPDWTVAIAPQNAQSDEPVRTGIVERNFFISGSGTRDGLYLAASDISVRDNIFDLTGGIAYHGVEVSRRGIEPPPTDNRLNNNTCYSADAGAVTCLILSGSATGGVAQNNLLAAPNASSATVVSSSAGDTQTGGNLILGSPGFVSAAPSQPADFQLSASSAAVDAGTGICATSLDFAGFERPADGNRDGTAQCDVGAYELIPSP